MVAEVLHARRDLFDVPDDVAYFNAASLSPMLHAVREAGCFVARRGDALRVAPHLHITATDVDRLVTTLTRAI